MSGTYLVINDFIFDLISLTTGRTLSVSYGVTILANVALSTLFAKQMTLLREKKDR